MIHDFLASRLKRVLWRQRQLELWRGLTVVWSVAAIVTIGFVYLHSRTGWASELTLPLLAALAASISVAVVARVYAKPPDYRALATKVEATFPELNGVLLTAVQQQIDSPGELSYLQQRLLQQAVGKAQERDWRRVVPGSHLATTHLVHLATIVILVLVGLRLPSSSARSRGQLFPVMNAGVSVTPGNTSIEKGESLVVLAKFSNDLPAEVNLIARAADGTERTVPLAKSLGDPIYGGSIRDVVIDFTYRLEYEGKRTEDFKVTVFEHPRLERADAQLVFPAYTSLPEKRIEDTRRISAVEGTQLSMELQLNKPVETAVLVARDEGKTELPLSVTAGKASVSLPAMTLAQTATYDLKLVDADGRANKTATPFVIEVVPNRTPELRVASPQGDTRPSSIEELGFGGTVWDDFGAPAFGIGYSVAGGDTTFIELGKDVPAKERRSYEYLLGLETMGMEPGQLISWFVWADDIGPDAQIRRTTSDLYFAEIRPFDEIFRESQNMGGQQQGGQQGGQQAPQQRLVELQKQIINATWRLQRTAATSSYAADATVVQESQAQALEQARSAQQESRDPRQQVLWSRVLSDMEKAVTQLRLATASPKPLPQALSAEQSAYQALLQLQARETSVTRQQGGGGGGGQQPTQRQLEQLDLEQAENRYETQRIAQAPQSPERREENQVLNRLQELARRQQDFNDRLRELQTALQEAKTEAEREELRRQLRRLQEEQQQMLADADELQQRMQRPENQSRMSEQSQQLEQTREELQRSAEAAGRGDVAQALASGTRAQRDLQSMRDELRKESSSQFAEDLRTMRAEARNLAQDQKALAERMANLGEEAPRRTLSEPESPERMQLAEELAQQRERLESLIEQATEVSSQAENTEPLLARELYDSLRKVAQDDVRNVKELQQDLLGRGQMTRRLYDQLQQRTQGEENGRALAAATDLLRENLVPQARDAEQRARAGIEDLMRGVERAAERVVGDDAESLRIARAELDAVTEQLRREISEAQRGQAGGDPSGQEGSEPGQPGQRGQRTASQSPGETAEAGEGGDPSSEPGEGMPGPQPGQRSQGLAQSGQPGQQGQSGEQSGSQAGQSGSEDQQQQSQTQPGGARAPRSLAQGGGQPQRGGASNGGGARDAGGGGFDFGGMFDGADYGAGPITGEAFAGWSDRLRDVEELIDEPGLRSDVAQARERARLLRREFRQELKKPDWAVVELEIVRPLVEVRNRLAEELARRESKDSLVPIDRDPVPNRYADQVRRYYEELGKDNNP
ncbi:hypothetical protein MASR2M8_08180 [Opitutaceae bacterium]